MPEPQWITDKLPKMELSVSSGFMWRSKLVFIYDGIQGRTVAELRANEAMQWQWWVLRHSGQRIGVESVLGWLPLDTLPGRPHDEEHRPQPWQLNDDNQHLLLDAVGKRE